MFVATNYRMFLDRFFVLSRMERLATTRLHVALDMQNDEKLRASLHEALQLIHQQKLQLVADLQKLMLSSSTSPLGVAQMQQ
jgi:hypothetical protein